MSLTPKQRQIMTVLIKANPDGSFLDVDQLLENLPYKTSKASIHFSIRALEKKGLMCKMKKETRRSRVRAIVAPTTDGFNAMR